MWTNATRVCDRLRRLDSICTRCRTFRRSLPAKVRAAREVGASESRAGSGWILPRRKNRHFSCPQHPSIGSVWLIVMEALNYWLIFWVLCGFVAAMIGARKGIGSSGFVVGFLLGPFGILIALLSKGDRKACLYCREWIHKDATVCPRCQREAEPMFDVRCPACGEPGQVRESFLAEDIECPKCKRKFAAAGARI